MKSVCEELLDSLRARAPALALAREDQKAWAKTRLLIPNTLAFQARSRLEEGLVKVNRKENGTENDIG